jgi:hypothetical protein
LTLECGRFYRLNLHLLRAALAELGVPAQARLDPAEGRCCVTITPG